MPLSKKIFVSFALLAAGIAFGVISKVLDETSSNLLLAWLEMLDLRNFLSRMGFWILCGVCISTFSKTPLRAALNTFLFFAGMVGSYYAYTMIIAGFYPTTYMTIWVVVTAVSPIFAAICWYAKGTHIVSICIGAVIFALMARQAFAFGFWHFDVRNGLELLLWIATVVILFKTPKQIGLVAAAGTLLFLILSPLNLFMGMM